MLAYLAWGFLSPVGQILLRSMGPFTLNTVRTFAAMPLLVLVFGPRSARVAAKALARPPAWALGGWLALTFVPYLWSLRFLPPTITTLTVYLTPLVVAAWQRLVLKEPVSRLVVPTIALTVLGAALAVGSKGGVALDHNGLLGLGLALLGVTGWSAYTIHLKRLTAAADADALTLAAFATSGLLFLAGGIAFEGLHLVLDRSTLLYLALYVVFPGVVSFWLYSRALQQTDATTVAVLIGAELVATAVVSRLLTTETFTLGKVAGLAVVVLAVTAFLLNERARAGRANA